MTRRLAFFTAILLAMLSGYAQPRPSYSPRNPDSVTSYIEAMTARKAAVFTGNYQKDAQKILQERKEEFLKSIRDSAYVFDPKIQAYFNSIVAEIYRSNPEIDHKDFYFFIDKSPVPNAACYGNGIFTINLGLFDVLASDDEMAFTICHEMAHDALKHIDKSISERIEKMRSKDTRKQVRQAANQSYGARRALMDVVKKMQYNFLRRSRDAEMQADSLGLKFLKKTRFNASAAYTSLEKLGKCDSLLFTADTKIRQRFNFADFPFRDDWIQPEKTLFDLKESVSDYDFDKDSLKTHPDIPDRLKKITLMDQGHGNVAGTPRLADLRRHVIATEIMVSIDDSRLDMALYQCMTYFDDGQIDEKTYARTCAYILRRAYDLKVSHQLGKYVSEPGNFSQEKYLDEVKRFMISIEPKPLRKLGVRFCRQYASEMAGDAQFAETLAYFEKLNTN